MRHEAIRALYSNVVTIAGTSSTDKDGNEVAINESNVSAKITELEAKQVIIEKIETLEAEVTQRRIRDAFADPTWMNAQEAKIATERAKL